MLLVEERMVSRDVGIAASRCIVLRWTKARKVRPDQEGGTHPGGCIDLSNERSCKADFCRCIKRKKLQSTGMCRCIKLNELRIVARTLLEQG